MNSSNKTFAVATKAVIYDNGKYLVLHKSASEEMNPNSYDIPGGRLEFGEKPEETLVREVKEETGLTVQAKGITEVWSFTKETFQLVGITFLCFIDGGKNQLSSEHSSFEWVTSDEVKKNNYPEWLKKSILKAEEFLHLIFQ